MLYFEVIENMTKHDKAITLAFTGASGAPYGLRLLECLLAADYQVYLLISSAARVVLATEHELKLPAGPDAAKQALVKHLGCDPEKLMVPHRCPLFLQGQSRGPFVHVQREAWLQLLMAYRII